MKKMPNRKESTFMGAQTSLTNAISYVRYNKVATFSCLSFFPFFNLFIYFDFIFLIIFLFLAFIKIFVSIFVCIFGFDSSGFGYGSGLGYVSGLGSVSGLG